MKTQHMPGMASNALRTCLTHSTWRSNKFNAARHAVGAFQNCFLLPAQVIIEVANGSLDCHISDTLINTCHVERVGGG